MNKIKFVLRLAISIALAFTFSCSSGGGSGGDDPDNGGNGQGVSFNENSQIYNTDGSIYKGSGVIEINSGNDCSGDCEWDHIRVGSVASGIVNLNLPPTIPDEYLTNFRRYCADYLQDLKIYFVEPVLTNSNGNYIGELVIRDKQNVEEGITYTYFSKSEKINCNSNEDDFNHLGFNYNFNIDVKKGWNKIYSKANYVNGKIATVEYSTNNILTKEVKWVIKD